jgi:acetolactate synthase-1/2/3 large subunit
VRAQANRTQTGGQLVVASLEALGAEVVFGIPGTHSLSIWEGLRTSPIEAFVLRTELDAGFAADGYARASGRPATLVLTTGPAALMALAALMEAATVHVPVVAIASQIPRELIGRGRGYLHELDDQLASFEPVVKWAARAERAEEIPTLLAEAWHRAQTPPSGPVFLEIPVDVLRGETSLDAPGELGELDTSVPSVPAPASAVAEAARLVDGAQRPVIWAGGGVQRSAAWDQLAGLAERLEAPVATTYMGKGTFPEDHPLALGSACACPALLELLAAADVLVCVGTELGAETTAQHTLRFSGSLIQIDADPARIGASYPALGLVGDARATLAALAERVASRPAADGGAAAANELRERIARGVEAQGRPLERGLLETIRTVLPRNAVNAWDMTILAYWAAEFFPAVEPRRFLYPIGSGTLGYAWPAALGAAVALPDRPTLAVVGDGGFSYGLAGLATARQHALPIALLVIDDGGYGVLRGHQRHAYGETYAVDLVQPDFTALAGAFGVPARTSTPEALAADLQWALTENGPAVVVLPALLDTFTPI